MANPTFRLVNTRYVPPGVYIGQLIIPRPVNLTADARLPAFVGVGNRLATGKNIAIRRAFVYDEQLTFSPLSPHVALVDFNADQDQNAPGIQLRKSDGTKVRTDFWNFTETVTDSGTFDEVTISLEAFDPTATYFIDYQSEERTPLDTIPVEELREVVNVGLSEDSPQFKEFVDFIIVTDLTDILMDAGNSNTDSVLEAVVQDSGNTGSGVVSQSESSEFDHNYNRYYQLECISASGSSPNRIASFTYTSTPISGGNGALPPRPLQALEAAPTINVVEVTNQFDVAIELDIKLDFVFPGGAGNFAVADEFDFMAFGPSLIEADARYDNTNQFVETGTVLDDDAAGTGEAAGTGSIAVAASSTFDREFNTGYTLHVIGIAGSSPSRTVTFVWSAWGEISPNGTFTADEAVAGTLLQSLAFDIEVDIEFGASNFVMGDEFVFMAYAPQLYYTGKDNRNYTLTHGVATSPVPTPTSGYVEGEYNTDTPEGGFGTYEVLSTSTFDDDETGHFLFPDNVKLAFRNMQRARVIGNQHVAGNEYTFSALDENKIDWSLEQEREQEFEVSDIIVDVNGAVTGTSGASYVIIDEVPVETTVAVTTTTGNAPVASIEITASPFIALPVPPIVPFTVDYRTRGDEADPGQLYYFTGNFLRGDELYNNPILVLDRDDGRTLLGPSTVDNHLHIANELAFDNNVFGVYYVQVADADEDGVFQQTDFKTALLATEEVDGITDRIVLARQDAWGDQLAVNERANDPFEKRESLDWFGAPIGTPIGDRQTPDTLRFISDKTLRVFGQSPSHGTRILVAPTTATVNVVLQSGDTVTVTLDGSFVAGALASLTASFSDPANTVLKKNLGGFQSVQTYTEKENVLLGDGAMDYFTDLGNGVIRIEEDTTVDTSSADFYLISAMTQKQFVTKVVRREMENSVIALVVPSAEAGVGIIKATLSGILLGLLGRGIIGQYEDDNGNSRKYDPSSDIVVFRDSADPTLYHMFYAYFLRMPIKRVFGLFTVNSNDFGVGSGS